MIIGNQDTVRHARPRWFCLWLALMAIALSHPLWAQDSPPLRLTGPAPMDQIAPHMGYMLDPDWQLSPADILAGPVTPLSGPSSDFGYTPARIWLHLPVVNDTDTIRSWQFFVHANFTQSITIDLIGADGAVQSLLDLGLDSPFAARPVDYPQMVAPFDLEPGAAATLVISYYSQGSSRMSMSIETIDSFAAQARDTLARSYAFYGMMALMVVLAVAALLVLRQWVIGAYLGYISALSLYIAHADGAAFQYLWPAFPRFNSMASVVAGSGVMICAALFAIGYLQTRRYHLVMHRALSGVILTVVALDTVLWLTDPQLLKRLLVLMLLGSLLMCVTAAIVAAWTRYREVRFYLFAWGAALIPAGLFVLRYAFGIEPRFIATYDAVRLSLVVDALMMGLALFDRFNTQRRAALQETLNEMQRNLSLTQRLAALEGDFERANRDSQRREASVKDTVHDLRQPMQALRLSLRQMAAPGQSGAQDAGQVESALAYMERLVAERLADQAPAPVAVDEPGIHAVLRGVVDMFAPQAAAKGLTLSLRLAAPDGPVAAYPLMRACANLVSNAIKYTPSGRVLVGLRRQAGDWLVEVHDTGPGLSGADFATACARHARLDRDSKVAEGSGLGLAVVTGIMAAQGWRLTASDDRRTGASLRLILPGAEG